LLCKDLFYIAESITGGKNTDYDIITIYKLDMN